MPPTSQGPNPPSQYSYPQRYPTPPNPQQGIRGPYPPHQVCSNVAFMPNNNNI